MMDGGGDGDMVWLCGGLFEGGGGGGLVMFFVFCLGRVF